MSEARDGEQLGDALQQPDDDRVEVREVVHARPSRYVLVRRSPCLWKTSWMRRLVVVRHAKAQRTSPRGDHGRELAPKGRAQAAALRTWTEGAGPLADVRGTVVVSDSARTLETFELGLAGTPVCVRAVVDPTLYNGVRDVDTAAVLRSLSAADPGDGDLVVVGHNPTVVYLVADLADDPRVADRALDDGFPMCGVAVLAFDGAAPTPRGCELGFFGAPPADERP